MYATTTTLSKAIQQRRSIYAIGSDVSLTDGEIEGLVAHSVKHVPTAFNSQGSRVVLLLHDQNKKLWDLAWQLYKNTLSKEIFAKAEVKLLQFAAGYGTVLFFEDQDAIARMQKRFPNAKEKFQVWSLESAGMLQFSMWISLEEKGLGASLQHYNPVIDQMVREEWKVPESWKLIAEMPFGSVKEKPDRKYFAPLQNRIKVFK